MKYEKTYILQLLAEHKHEEARSKCEALLEEDDKDTQAWLIMARIHLHANHAAAALSCCQTAASLAPSLADAVYLAGMAYKAIGNLSAAIQAFSHVIKSDEGNYTARVQLAAAQAENGQYAHAVDNYRFALQLKPDNIAVLCNIGHALHATGEYAEAISYYRRAIGKQPALQIAHINLAFSLQSMGEYGEALASYRAAQKIDPYSISAITGEADILYRTGLEEESLALVTPLLEKHSNHIPLITLYASMARSHGQYNTALAYVDQCLNISGIERLDRIQLNFSAGLLYDADSAYKKAFYRYKKANQLVITNYNADLHEHCVSDAIRYFSPDIFRKLSRSCYKDKKPVFIIGMPRSGTSLVEQILASHPRVFAGGELPDIHQVSLSLAGCVDGYPACLGSITSKQINEESYAYIRKIDSLASCARRVTDKTPHNYLHVPLIRLMFPEARIIHCMRHPLDTCLSCYFRAFNGGNDYSYNLSNLGRHFHDYWRLMRHWQQSLGISMLDLRYENLVQDQKTYSRAIVEFCGLEWDEQCSAFYKTRRVVPSASFDQVNKPMYTYSIQRWQQYEEYLGELVQCLGSVVEEYESGYIWDGKIQVD